MLHFRFEGSVVFRSVVLSRSWANTSIIFEEKYYLIYILVYLPCLIPKTYTETFILRFRVIFKGLIVKYGNESSLKNLTQLINLSQNFSLAKIIFEFQTLEVLDLRELQYFLGLMLCLLVFFIRSNVAPVLPKWGVVKNRYRPGRYFYWLSNILQCLRAGKRSQRVTTL